MNRDAKQYAYQRQSSMFICSFSCEFCSWKGKSQNDCSRETQQPPEEYVLGW